MATSGETGCGRTPATVSSSIAISEPLRAEEQFRRPQHERIVAPIEHVAQDHVHELIDEQRRRRSGAAAHEVAKGRLQSLVSQQLIAEGNDHAPVFPRISVGNRGDLRSCDRTAWIAQQRAMERTFGAAGVGRGNELGAGEVGFQKFVTHDEPAAGVAIEQMVPAGEPEVLHAARTSTQCRHYL